MRIGILGSGLMGSKLGTLFARAGHEVIFSYSRDHKKLERLARDAGALAGTPAEAAERADAVLLAVHWSHLSDVLGQAGGLSGKVIVSCTLPMNNDDSDLKIGHTSSGVEELARIAKGASVVAAFNRVPSEVLFGVFERRHRTGRSSMIYYGDDSNAKRVTAQLISDVGFEPVDGGPLRTGRYAEPWALLVAQIAYEGVRGPEVAYRFEWFNKSA